MTKTHFIVSAAIALSIGALIAGRDPVAKVKQSSQSKAAPDATLADDQVKVRLHLSHEHPLEGKSFWAAVDVEALSATKAAHAAQLVLVLDHSGSMQGDKMEKAKAAALGLIDRLEERDSLAVVAFDSNVIRTELISADDAGKARLRQFVANIYANSGTNISLGLDTARTLLAAAPVTGTRRIILVSDGQPTEGRTSPDALYQMATELKEQVGAVSALGVGVDFNGPLMTQLAASGGGFYGYLKDTGALAEVLSKELNQARYESLSSVELALEAKGPARIGDVAGRRFAQGSSTTVSLPSLAPGQSETVYVRLDLDADASADVALGAALHYRDGAGSLAMLPLSVRAVPTDSEAVSKQGVDQRLADEGLRVLGSQQMVQAAQAFQRGDRASAFALLDNARGLFGMSADALAGDISDAEATKSRWQHTTDSAAVNHEALQLEQKKMLSFGENNAY